MDFLLHSLERMNSHDHTSCGVQLGLDGRRVCGGGFPDSCHHGGGGGSQTVTKQNNSSSPPSHSSKNSQNAVVFLPTAELHPPPQSLGPAVISLPQY